MRRTQAFQVLVLGLFASSLTAACGGGGSGDSAGGSSGGLSTISSLPKATGAVTGASSSSVGSSAATTGVRLKDVDDSATWTGGGKSRPMCELATMTREILRDASSTDRTLCYVGKMQQLGKFSQTLDDGNYKYYNVSFSGSPSMRVKFRIVKDSSGAISSYTMFTCQTADSGSTYSQNEYLNQSISAGVASITAKNIGSNSGGGMTFSYGSQTTVTGSINSSGAWTSKLIQAARTFSYDGAGQEDGAFHQKLSLTQAATNMILDGYNSATFYNAGKMGGAGASTFSMRMYGKTQILGASSLPTIAFGDGTAKAIMAFDGTDVSGAGSGVAATKHWAGDTALDVGTSDYAADVASATPRVDDGAVTVSFTAGETWDCATTESGFSSADISSGDMATVETCDSEFGFGTGEDGGSNACFAMP